MCHFIPTTCTLKQFCISIVCDKISEKIPTVFVWSVTKDTYSIFIICDKSSEKIPIVFLWSVTKVVRRYLQYLYGL